MVGADSEIQSNTKIYSIAVEGTNGNAEVVRDFAELDAALAWLDRASILRDIDALMTHDDSPARPALGPSAGFHYADLHDVLSYAPLVLIEYVLREGRGLELLYASDASEEVLGLLPHSFLENDHRLLERVHKDDRKALAALLSSHDALGAVFKEEVRYQHPVNGELWLQVAVAATPRTLRGERIKSGYILDITEKKRLELKLQKAATRDALTSLLNRGHLISQLEIEHLRSRRYRHPLSIVMFDVDRFKAINDRFGHLAGDEVLRGVADIIRRVARVNDRAGRYGGEEFLLVLPETALGDAAAVAERLRALLEAIEILSDGNVIRVTASFGVACADPEHPLSVKELLAMADRALYEAKGSGRNRVRLFGQRISEEWARNAIAEHA